MSPDLSSSGSACAITMKTPDSIADLKPAIVNPRGIQDKPFAGLQVSLEAFGDISGITWNSRSGRLVTGHQRLKALKKLHGKELKLTGTNGIRHVETPDGERFQVRVVDWDEAMEKAANIAANSPKIAGEFTDDAVQLIEEVQGELPDLSEGLMLEELSADIDDITTSDRDASNSKKQKVKIGIPENPVSERGSIWTLGKHRLLCDDCRSPDAFARLFENERCDLVITDPPYCSGGFQEAGKAAGTFGNIASDNLSTRGYIALMREWIATANPQIAYIFTDWRMWITLYDVVESSGLPVRGMLVWAKESAGLGSLWRAQHELVMFSSREGTRRIKGRPSFGNILTAKRTGNIHHYTEKPIDLLVTLIKGDQASGRRGLIYDPFAGSGSTMIAAEQARRQARCMEIEPAFCDIAIGRWQEETGKDAIMEDNGKTFNELNDAKQ